MSKGEDWLTELAASIADGKEIDWSRLPTAVDREPAHPAVNRLRIVAQVVSGFQDAVAEATRSVEWGRLSITQPIGSGSSGEVFRAFDPGLQCSYALKLVKPFATAEEKERAFNEGRVLARIRHPHIVTVYGIDEYDGRLGLWMELIQGETLSRGLERSRLSAREAAGIGIDLCGALAAVHAQGVIHRDIKAQNVMREKDGRIVLMDFGLGSRLLEDGTTRPPTGLQGTPFYMAPELFQGEPATVRSDIYALGVLLFHLVTRDFPLEGRSMDHLRQAHARQDYQLLRDLRPELPGQFIEVVERALAPSPERRFPSAGQLERALIRSTVGKGRTWIPPLRIVAASVVALLATLLILFRTSWTDPTPGLEVDSVSVIVLADVTDDRLRPYGQVAYYMMSEFIGRSTVLQPVSNSVYETTTDARRAGVDFALRVQFIEAGGLLRGFAQIERLSTAVVVASRNEDIGFEDAISIEKLSKWAVTELEKLAFPGSGSEEPAGLGTYSLEAWLHLGRARQSYKLYQYQEALEWLDRAIERDRDFVYAYALKATIYDNLGERDKAVENSELAQEKAKKTGDILLQMRMSYALAQTREDWCAYGSEVESLAKLQDRKAYWRFLRGWYHHYHSRQNDRALAQYGKAIALDPVAWPDTYRYRGDLHLALGDTRNALENYRQFKALLGDTSATLTVMVRYHLERGDYARAASLLESALVKKPDAADASLEACDVKAALGNSLAEGCYAAYLARVSQPIPRDDGLFRLGLFYLRAQRWKEALVLAPKLRTDRPRSDWLLGMAQHGEGDGEAARLTLAKMADDYASGGTGLQAEYFFHLKGVVETAAAAFETALQLGPFRDRALFLQGAAEAYRSRGRLDQAEDAFERALDFNPRYIPSLLGMAATLERLERPREAYWIYRRAVDILENPRPDWHELKRAREGLGRLEAQHGPIERNDNLSALALLAAVLLSCAILLRRSFRFSGQV